MTDQVAKMSQLLHNHEVTEFLEWKTSSFGFDSVQKLLEFVFLRGHGPLPRQYIFFLDQLLWTDVFFIPLSYFLEILPEFVVETNVYHDPLEHAPAYQEFGQRGFAFDFQRGSVSPKDDWLSVEQHRKFKDISESLVDFCQREMIVSIDVESSEEFLPF